MCCIGIVPETRPGHLLFELFKLRFFIRQVKASPGFSQSGPTTLISLSLIPQLPFILSSTFRRLSSIVCRPSSVVRRLSSVVCRPSSVVCRPNGERPSTSRSTRRRWPFRPFPQNPAPNTQNQRRGRSKARRRPETPQRKCLATGGPCARSARCDRLRSGEMAPPLAAWTGTEAKGADAGDNRNERRVRTA